MSRPRFLCVALVLASTACALQPRLESGPDAEVTHDGLVRVEGAAMDAAWLRPDLDLRGYDRVLLQVAGIEFRPVKDVASGPERARASRSTYPITEANRAKLALVVTGAFRQTLEASKRFKVVDQPGPGVLLVRSTLLDVVLNVPPETAGRSEIYLSQIGEATLVLEVRDALSGAILARAVDRRAAENLSGMGEMSSATTWSEVTRLAQRWATLLRSGLERLADQPLRPQ